MYVLHEMFIELSLFQETSPAPKNSWLRAWMDYDFIKKLLESVISNQGVPILVPYSNKAPF